MNRAALIAVGLLTVVTSAVWVGCLGGSDPLPPAVDEPRGEPIRLADLDATSLVLPPDSRGGKPPVDGAVVEGWTHHGVHANGMHRFTRPNMWRPRGLFFFRPKGDSRLEQGGKALAYKYKPKNRLAGPTWFHDRTTTTVFLPTEVPPTDLRFHFKRAINREARLNRAFAKVDGAGMTDAEFTRLSAVEAWSTRKGLLLPAPARASFDVTLPEAPMLRMAPGLIRPELSDLGVSDGCRLTVQVSAGDTTETVYDASLTLGSFDMQSVDLSKWSEKPVSITFETHPGDTTLYDYCFVGEPMITPRKAHPRRVVMVFVDTLRPDHLTLYGYDRETTPNLSKFAGGAVVFENARSIAPWTLPSARTVVTGRQPEHYATSPTVQEQFADAGFATGMVAGNVYLSNNFDMERGWDFHDVGMWPPANEVTDQALGWLEDHEGQDSLLLVHYMSAHLPYREPLSYRNMWAGVGPAGLRGEFHLRGVRKANLRRDPDGQQYVKDRYDQCVRFIDDELARLYDQLDDNDIVVLFSDHGEEFWDHGGFEHGHTLYDELLRVPMVIKAPGLKPGRITEPVSLLDITPTLLELAELPPLETVDGTSLVALAKRENTAIEAFKSRPQAIGRPLYGNERWGVIEGSTKWTTFEGREMVFDLTADPGEQKNRVNKPPKALDHYRDLVGEILGEGGTGLRFYPQRGVVRSEPLHLTVHVPGGHSAWMGNDPLQNGTVSVAALDAETVRFTWDANNRNGSREAYVLPKSPVAEASGTIAALVEQGKNRCRLDLPTQPVPPTSKDRQPLTSIRLGSRGMQVTWSFAPHPDGTAIDVANGDMKSALEAIGYVQQDEDPESGGAGSTEGSANRLAGEAFRTSIENLAPCPQAGR